MEGGNKRNTRRLSEVHMEDAHPISEALWNLLQIQEKQRRLAPQLPCLWAANAEASSRADLYATNRGLTVPDCSSFRRD
jgi:hypothetical protein